MVALYRFHCIKIRWLGGLEATLSLYPGHLYNGKPYTWKDGLYVKTDPKPSAATILSKMILRHLRTNFQVNHPCPSVYYQHLGKSKSDCPDGDHISDLIPRSWPPSKVTTWMSLTKAELHHSPLDLRPKPQKGQNRLLHSPSLLAKGLVIGVLHICVTVCIGPSLDFFVWLATI